MTGKTHMAAGIAAGLLCSLPSTSPVELCVAVSAGCFGGLICDLDAEGSKARKAYARILSAAVVSCALLFAVEQFSRISILDLLWQQAGVLHCLGGLLMLFVLCVFGINCRHRTFMHSLPALVLISWATYLISPAFAFPTAAGMASHIFLDIFNKKKIQLLYPIRRFGRVGLRLCKADGKADLLICLICTAVDILFVIGKTAYMIFNGLAKLR